MTAITAIPTPLAASSSARLPNATTRRRPRWSVVVSVLLHLALLTLAIIGAQHKRSITQSAPPASVAMVFESGGKTPSSIANPAPLSPNRQASPAPQPSQPPPPHPAPRSNSRRQPHRRSSNRCRRHPPRFPRCRRSSRPHRKPRRHRRHLRRRHHSPHRNHYRRPPPRPPPRPPHRRRLPRPCRCPHQSPCPRPGRHRSPKRRACPSLGSQPGQCRRRAQPPHSRRPWISPWDRAQPRGTPSHPGRALRPERSICRLRR